MFKKNLAESESLYVSGSDEKFKTLNNRAIKFLDLNLTRE